MKFTIAILLLYLLVAQISSVYAISAEIPEIPLPEAAIEDIPPLSYASASVVLMEASTGVVLYATEGDYIRYPASITKIMTALIVLEHAEDLGERIEFSERAVFSIPRDSSHIAMDVGETLTIYEALYGLMLASANEVSLALAEHIAGSIENFVDLMNRRAQALGAIDTYFVNPSGLPSPGHVTTAYDMAIIMREAVRHPIFVDIIAARRFDIMPTERQPQTRELLNTNRLIQPGTHFNESVIGGKTGWTNIAGHTLVTYAEQDGRRLIVSVLGGESPGTFTDTTALLNFGFSMPFEPVQIFNAAAYTPTVPLYQDIDGTRTEIGRVVLRAADDIYFNLPTGFDTSLLRYNLSVPQALAPPIEEGTILGRVSVYIQNFRIGEAPLMAAEAASVYIPSAIPQPLIADTTLSNQPALHLDYETAYSYSPGMSLWSQEYTLIFAVPIGISAVTLLISLILFTINRKKRSRRALHARYARYPQYYRYK